MIYLTSPHHFTLAYSINAWMDTTNTVDTVRANAQWDTLKTTLSQYDDITVVDGDRYPDSVFIANAGLLVDDTCILSRFRHKERRREESVWKSLFEERGYSVIQPPEHHYFEGAGDALFFRGHLIGGTGFRSTANTYEWITEQFHIPTIPITLTNPYFYHLDTCFCPLNENTALIYPDAFSRESLEQLRSLNGTLIEVPKEEAYRFACNAVAVDATVLIPKGNPKTEHLLYSHGWTPIFIDMSEYMKSGGAAKCVTLTPQKN